MKIIFSRMKVESRKAVEKEFERHVEKLSRFFKKYDSDLVTLRASVAKIPRKTEYTFSLNLILPTGTLHADGTGADMSSSAKAAFAEVEAQVKKHQQKLRKDYVWKRKRGRGVPKLGEMPSAE